MLWDEDPRIWDVMKTDGAGLEMREGRGTRARGVATAGGRGRGGFRGNDTTRVSEGEGWILGSSGVPGCSLRMTRPNTRPIKDQLASHVPTGDK